MTFFLYLVFFIAGLVIGGSIGDFGGALIGGLLGLFAFSAIQRSNRSSAPPPPLAALPTVQDLMQEIEALHRRIDALTTRLDAMGGAAASPVPPSEEAETFDIPDTVPMPDFAPPASAATAPAAPPPPVEEAVPTGMPIPPAPVTPPESAWVAEPAAPGWFDAARNWLFGGNALVRVGVVVLFFGLAFLVKFAAEHAVLPIEARYIGGGLGALVALTLGWRLRLRRLEYALALQGLGIASLYLLTFAAFRLHDLLPPGLTMALLVATCALSAALAILQDARSMAIVGICGGFLAPVLASTGSGSHVALFSYYALLNAGIVAIAWFKAWRPLNVLGFLFTFGIGSLWASRSYRDELFASTEPFLLLFFGLYLVVALLYAGRRRLELSRRAIEVGGERIDYVDGTLVFGNPLVAFGLQYLMVKDMAYGSAFSALGLGMIYLPLASGLYSRHRDDFRLLVESFLALGVIFASLAIPLGLDAQWTSAAWAVEGAGIFWVGQRQSRPVAQVFALLLQLGSAISLLQSLDTSASENLLGLVPMLDGAVLGPLLVGGAILFTAQRIRNHDFDDASWRQALEPLLTVAGFAFVGLTLPLLLDQLWTGLALAAYGAGLVLWARFADHAATQVFGMAVQVVGGFAFATATSHYTAVPLLNRFWLGSLLIGSAGLFSGWQIERRTGRVVWLSLLGLVWGLLWWSGASLQEIDRHVASPFVLAAQIGLATLTAALLLLGGRLASWAAAELAAFLLAPALLLAALNAFAAKSHPAIDGGWLAWPAALAMLWLGLRRLEERLPTTMAGAGHTFALLLATALATWQCSWWFGQFGDPASAWPVLGAALVPAAVLLALGSPRLAGLWPLAAWPQAYRLASLPIAGLCWLRFLAVNGSSDGSAQPLPTLPLANPTDLAAGATLLVLFAWSERWPGEAPLRRSGRIVLAASVFYWLNGVLLRALHHWAEIPFDLDLMLRSTLVQASLSLFWSALALAMMLFATRRGWRSLWLTGGALLAVVVGKLFVIDLASVGSIERIVSFIGVGILLLVIGYFSPVPPKRQVQP